jgi:chemotaxis protein CheY-P-specific phosphatase CheC
MINSKCLVGPPFSIAGNALFVNQKPGFTVNFDNAPDRASVLAYQWYLDGSLIVGLDQDSISFNTAYGVHTIGVRILTSQGWSGIKLLDFRSYGRPELITISGPAFVNEGEVVEYSLEASFSDKYILNVTDQALFTLMPNNRGEFTDNSLTLFSNPAHNDAITTIISASYDGLSTSFTITITDTTPVGVVSLAIKGTASVNEGSGAIYQVIATLSDGSTELVSGQAVFTLGATSRGEFTNNTLAVFSNQTHNDSITTNISASYKGLSTDFSIEITDTTPVTVVSLAINGPSSVNEGSVAAYQVTTTFSNGNTRDDTAQYTFSATEGAFSGASLTINANSANNDTRQITITASKSGSTTTLTKQVNIADTTLIPFSFTTNWAFTELGAKSNNWDGSVRTYTSGNIPVGALWSINTDNLGLRISYENSLDCGGTNDLIQSGTATATIIINQGARLKLLWTGLGEAEADAYERAEFFVNDVMIGNAHSPGGNKGCEMAAIVGKNYFPDGYTLTAGSHILKILSTTQDNQFHVGAYYQFSLQLFPL